MSKCLALVTGASRGIGRSIAEALSKAGYQVVGSATSEAGADAIKAHLQSLNPENDGICLNISDAQQTQDSLQALLKEKGVPLVLVNNAGITKDNLLLRMNEDDWQAVINTNLTGTFRVCKQLCKAMIKQKAGSIINVSSIVGATGNGGQSNYAASKAGLEAFSRSLAQEVASRGLTVNCIAPGFIQTDMTDALPDAQKESMLSNIPAKRFGEPEDIAQAVVFLASDGAKYINGQTIHVNGGMNMG